MANSPTVIALSSGALPSGVAVIRISGPHAFTALESIAGTLPEARKATLRALRSGDGERLDQALIFAFPGPGSFTGEDVAELHCHGGQAVVDGVLKALLTASGVSLAQAGDFTRQAFANGKLDLMQVEALGDLIHATTAAQKSLALDQLSGAASQKLLVWRDALIYIRAAIEADLDFSDEDDVPGSVVDSIPEQLRVLIDELHQDLNNTFLERLRDGFRVVLAGPPNSGKSTLLNALLQREAALVSPIAGTTRDQIDVAVDIDGLPVLLSDTAGLRDLTDDPLERLGMNKTQAALKSADCVVWLAGDDGVSDQFEHYVQDAIQRSIRVRSKQDIVAMSLAVGELGISGLTGEGLDDLKKHIANELRSLQSDGNFDHGQVALDVRRRTALQMAATHLSNALDRLTDPSVALDHCAEDLRLAQRSLAEITGEVGSEDILDALFFRFCIGK